jgi:hypothetical protein
MSGAGDNMLMIWDVQTGMFSEKWPHCVITT